MKFVTFLKRIFPTKVIEKGYSGYAPTNASKVIDVEGELYVRNIFIYNSSTNNAKVSVYSGDPNAGGVVIFEITVAPGSSFNLSGLKGIVATSDIYLVSDQSNVFVALGGEDYLA